MQPIDIDRRLVNVYGDEALDVGTFRKRNGEFQSGCRDLDHKPRSNLVAYALPPTKKVEGGLIRLSSAIVG